jgi:D-alanyl-D-alanine carboxypeptidase
MPLFGPLTPQAAGKQFDTAVCKAAKKYPHAPTQVTLVSDRLGLTYSDPSSEPFRPFHIASIGKVFTAVLVFKLVEQGVIVLDAPIAGYLPATDLADLFRFKGVDYAGEVTVRHLLGHTSGAADYFEDPVTSGLPFLQDVLCHPDTLWTPDSLLDFSRTKQAPAARPGERFHYSDTGYILLGKLVEAVTGQQFHTNLHAHIFDPLGMRDSYLLFYSEPAAQPQQPLAPLWVNGTEASRFQSLSCDWAGGGIVSTPADLLKFSRALAQGELVGATSYAAMTAFSHRFRQGIHYGLGLMEVHFSEFFFLLRGLPQVTGHIGILATHMFYDARTDTHIVMNFGDTQRMTQSFRVLIELLQTVKRIQSRV